MPGCKRYTKSEELIGITFEGTPDSAKEIVDWIKEIIGDQYQRGVMQRLTAKSNLGYDGREWYTGEPLLHISIDALPETYSLNVPMGGLVYYDPTRLEVRFRVTSPDALSHWKKEDIDGNIP